MKGRIASRAHSFKEGLLEAFGHHSGAGNHHSAVNGNNCSGGGGNVFFASKAAAASPAPSPNNNIHLAKTTGSTDNLIGEGREEGRSREVDRSVGSFQTQFFARRIFGAQTHDRRPRPRCPAGAEILRGE